MPGPAMLGTVKSFTLFLGGAFVARIAFNATLAHG